MAKLRGLLPALPREAWIFLGGTALSAIGSGLTLPFLFVYFHRIRGIGAGAAGLAVAAVALASFIGNPLGGSLSDRIGSRRTLILGLVISACGAASVTLVRDPWQAFAAAGTVGLGASISWPAQDTLLATVVRPEERSSVFSVRHAMLNAGFGLGGLTAAAILDLSRPGTFALIYLLDALSFLAFVPLLLRFRSLGNAPPAGRAREATGRAGYRVVLRDRVFVRVWVLTALLITAGYGQFSSSFPAFATRPGGIGVKALALVVAANTITVVVAQLFVLRLLNGRRRTRAIAALCGFWAATWAITLGAGTLGGGAVAVAAFALAMVVFAIGETLLTPTVPAIVNDLAPEEVRGRYNGVAVLAWTTGFMVGPAVGGLAIASERTLELFLALIATCGLAAILALRLERHLPRLVNRIGAFRDVPADTAPVKADAVAPSASP